MIVIEFAGQFIQAGPTGLRVDDGTEGIELMATFQGTRFCAALKHPYGKTVEGFMKIGKFLAVGKNTLFLPNKKISIFLGRFDIDSNYTQYFDVYHDPQISADQLTMPYSAKPGFQEPLRRLPNVDYDRLIPFFSADRVKLFSFGFSVDPRSKFRLILQPPMALWIKPEIIKQKIPRILASVDLFEFAYKAIDATFKAYIPLEEGGHGSGVTELWGVPLASNGGVSQIERNTVRALTHGVDASDIVLLSSRRAAA